MPPPTSLQTVGKGVLREAGTATMQSVPSTSVTGAPICVSRRSMTMMSCARVKFMDCSSAPAGRLRSKLVDAACTRCKGQVDTDLR